MNTDQIKAAITVSEMCELLSMSRSQVYAHIKRGTFHEPHRLTNGRPYFTASQVADNVKAKTMGIGVNGEYVLFYARNTDVVATQKPVMSKQLIEELVEGLQALGLSCVNSKQASDAIAACFPQGVAGRDESDVLRSVFRHLKSSGSV